MTRADDLCFHDENKKFTPTVKEKIFDKELLQGNVTTERIGRKYDDII